MKKILALTALTGALTFGTVTYTETKPTHVETDQAQAAVCRTEARVTSNYTTVRSINRCGHAQSFIHRVNGWNVDRVFWDQSPDHKNWSIIYSNYAEYAGGWANFW